MKYFIVVTKTDFLLMAHTTSPCSVWIYFPFHFLELTLLNQLSKSPRIKKKPYILCLPCANLANALDKNPWGIL